MRSPSREVALVRKNDLRAVVRNNAVTIMFVLLCIICMAYSGQSIAYVMYELFGRLSRNAFIVLALIIPIVAGMGINYPVYKKMLARGKQKYAFEIMELAKEISGE